MKFIVTDREGIESGIVVRSAYVVISIHDPDKPKARVRKQSGLVDVLHLAFHDAEPAANSRLPDDIVLMTEDHATQIWDFIGRHRDLVGTVVVHCEQGMSRSPAVAAALCRAFDGDEQRFFLEYQPNRHVYELVLNCQLGDGKEIER